jgi:hypothetical protein
MNIQELQTSIGFTQWPATRRRPQNKSLYRPKPYDRKGFTACRIIVDVGDSPRVAFFGHVLTASHDLE